jgi:hypothetical protein
MNAKREDYCTATELALWAEFHRLSNISEPLERRVEELKKELRNARRAAREPQRATMEAYRRAVSTPGGRAYMDALIGRRNAA